MKYYDKGNYKTALTYFENEAKQTESEYGKQTESYANALNNLAITYDAMGQYEKAEPLYKESIKIKKEILFYEDPEYATSLMNLGLLYKNIGQDEKAEMIYMEALNIWTESGAEKNDDYAELLNTLAVLYDDMGKYDKAESLFKDALKIRKEILGEKHVNYAQILNNLAYLYDDMGQYEKAEQYYIETLNILKEVLGKKHRYYAIALNNLATLYDNIGKYDKAEPLYIEALKIRKEVLGEKHPDCAISLYGLAGLYRTKGQYDKAGPLLSEANENYLNQLKTNYPSLSEIEKVKFMNTIEKNFEKYYSFELDRLNKNKSFGKEMLNLRINTKGLILSATSSIRKRIAESNDSELTEKFDKLLSFRADIGKAYTLSLEDLKKKEINISELETEANELEKEIGLKSEDFKSEVESRTITCTDIRNTLKQNEAAVEFLDFKYFNKKWTDTTYYCALIVRADLENPLLVKLCTLEDLREYLSGSSESNNSYVNDNVKSNGLYNIIWKPLEENLKNIDIVYLSLTGILNKVSFASLRADEQMLLIDKYQLRYIGNLKEIVSKKDSQTEDKIQTLMVFGGINYDLDTSNVKDIVSKINRGADEEWKPPSDMILKNAPETKVSKWSYLPGTLTEADNIKSIFEKNNLTVYKYTGENATKQVLKSLNNKNSPTVLHISTHGYFFPEPQKDYKVSGMSTYINSENPLFRSGLILAGANRVWTGGDEIEGVENGILTAYEVSNIDLQNTELVVLSACETGLGDIKGGEGVYGLQRAFKVAGAKTLIMSLWKVPDKETVELMDLFYTNWLSGMTKHDAFSSAQKEMRKKYAPYFWAAFVMVE